VTKKQHWNRGEGEKGQAHGEKLLNKAKQVGEAMSGGNI